MPPSPAGAAPAAGTACPPPAAGHRKRSRYICALVMCPGHVCHPSSITSCGPQEAQQVYLCVGGVSRACLPSKLDCQLRATGSLAGIFVCWWCVQGMFVIQARLPAAGQVGRSRHACAPLQNGWGMCLRVCVCERMCTFRCYVAMCNHATAGGSVPHTFKSMPRVHMQGLVVPSHTLLNARPGAPTLHT